MPIDCRRWTSTRNGDRVSSLDEIAAELYGVLPETFIETRDAHVKQARAAGERELARELGKLRRPTLSAWLVNQLARAENPALAELVGLADEYTAALAERDGARLKELTSRRRDLEEHLLTRAGELGAEAGVSPSDEILGEVRGTLDAMVSDPDVAAQVQAGRLVKAAGAAWAASSSPQGTKPARRSVKGAARGGTDSGPVDDDAAGAARAAEEAARAARDQAAAELAERTSEAERANAEYEQLGERLEQLRADVQALAQDVRVAQQNAVRAERRRANAERNLKKLNSEST